MHAGYMSSYEKHYVPQQDPTTRLPISFSSPFTGSSRPRSRLIASLPPTPSPALNYSFMSRSTAGDSSTSRPNASPTLGSTSASAPTSPASWASRFTSLLSRQQTSDSPRASSGAAATSVVERDVADGGGTSAAAFVDERSGGDEKGEKKEDDQDEVEQEGVVCASKAALTRVETLAEQLGGRSMGGKAVSETARVVAEGEKTFSTLLYTLLT